MAVIQDLPPELLIRILELSIDPRPYASSGRETRKTLIRTALVARCWRAPSQSLLSSLLHLDSMNPRWVRYNDVLSKSNEQHLRRMKRLELVVGRQDTSESALADQLAILKQKGVVLQELSFVSVSLRGTFRVPNGSLGWLVQGVRLLKLDTSIQIDADFPLPTTLLLDTLQISSRLPELPSFLFPFPTVAPRLTRLELDCSTGPFSPALNASLHELAPQITDLRIRLAPNSYGRPDDTVSSLDSFLRACTSVTTLRIENPAPPHLKHILSFLSHRLALLEISDLRTEGELKDPMPNDLAEALDLPCMAQLRRWRMAHSPYSRFSLSERAEEEWRAACRARGIEPRGAERFFTD
ncbi:hypothetical protein BCR35DRAFT_310652 [Leucosporidium creatinivorum]|uniref:F-box domain-containing protein n=1 Tax=Leucosporidium creatinivorum TaxID=106004 RepID=A0A1Y2CZ77_9BASI|nr:hypothetical protein BCR35DRAFT_310652 [Leucosporidium creatinivorum]